MKGLGKHLPSQFPISAYLLQKTHAQFRAQFGWRATVLGANQVTAAAIDDHTSASRVPKSKNFKQRTCNGVEAHFNGLGPRTRSNR
jgi:hypothetical protein